MISLRTAVGFLTRVPARPGPDLRRALPWFPLVGAAIGVLAAGTRWLADPLGPIGATVFAVAVPVVITGALHEDGLADLADAIPAPTRQRRFQIMDDPRAGTFGVLALVTLMLLRVALVLPLGDRAAMRALVAAHAGGRIVPGIFGRVLPPASSGLGSLARGRNTVPLVAADITTVAGVVLLAGPWSVLGGATVTVLLALSLRYLLGGITGDGMGAGVVTSEIAILAGAVPWLT